MAAILGCIADDFTGGTDLAGMLVKHGMRTVQMIGVPQAESCPAAVDAVVIALKSRTNPAPEAVRESLAALRWLQEAGCKQFYFKYCSTFDSTPQGNIGPVAEALMDALGADFTIACPAFPANRRTIYQGYLFVGDVLLNESGMRYHPLTPMTDANLVRVLQAQVRRRVGLVDYGTVSQGSGAIGERFAALRKEGYGFAVVDALSNQDLTEIGAACAGLPLVTAGSGLAVGLPENFRRKGMLAGNVAADALPATGGLRAVIAGSCSAATQGQVARMRERHPAFQVDPVKLAGGSDVAGAALDWAASRIGREPVLIYATSTPEAVKAVQAQLGAGRAGELVEEALAAVARGLVELGVGQMIVAGGETSGAVVKALGVKGLRIGPEIDPGVPWTVALQAEGTRERPLALALKSGNFGTPDFFLKAWSYFS
jgi:3-dehydrotetronate 4-kinase